MPEAIALIDYGAGNLHSVHNALRAAGAERVSVTADPEIVRGARRVVLPGVGSFKACADGLTGIPGMVAWECSCWRARGASTARLPVSAGFRAKCA